MRHRSGTGRNPSVGSTRPVLLNRPANPKGFSGVTGHGYDRVSGRSDKWTGGAGSSLGAGCSLPSGTARCDGGIRGVWACAVKDAPPKSADRRTASRKGIARAKNRDLPAKVLSRYGWVPGPKIESVMAPATAENTCAKAGCNAGARNSIVPDGQDVHSKQPGASRISTLRIVLLRMLDSRKRLRSRMAARSAMPGVRGRHPPHRRTSYRVCRTDQARFSDSASLTACVR